MPFGRSCAATVLLLSFLCAAPGSVSSQQPFRTQRDCCDYWDFYITRDQSKLKVFTEYQEGSIFIRKDEKSVMGAIECLLKYQGNKRRAGIDIDSAPETSSSGAKPHPRLEVMALYTITQIYGKPDNVHGAVLYDRERNANTRRSIKKAYKYYREWFAEVKRVGLAKAREMGLDPLKDKDVYWE